MRKTPEELDAIVEKAGDAAVRPLNENALRDAPEIDRIIGELDRKHALKKRSGH